MEFGAFGFGPLAPGGKRAGPPAPTKKIYQQLRISFITLQKNNCKSSIKPQAAYLRLGTLEGWEGLKETGSFTKSNDKDIYDSFLVFLSQVSWDQLTTLRIKYINSTQLVSQTISKETYKLFIE